MVRRRERQATELSERSEPAKTAGPSPSWSQWRPRPRIGFLAVTIFLLFAWLGFLLAMMVRK